MISVILFSFTFYLFLFFFNGEAATGSRCADCSRTWKRRQYERCWRLPASNTKNRPRSSPSRLEHVRAAYRLRSIRQRSASSSVFSSRRLFFQNFFYYLYACRPIFNIRLVSRLPVREPIFTGVRFPKVKSSVWQYCFVSQEK